MKFDWLKVRLNLVREVGSDAAVLYAYLTYGNLPRDKGGYLVFDSNKISKELGWSRRNYYRVRDKLVDAGYLTVVNGKNQNNKPRCRLAK